MIDRIVVYAAAFAATLLLTLVLTPLVREMNRRFGMVDKPDPRRINRVPIPRGGGVAIYLATLLAMLAFVPFCDVSMLTGSVSRFLRLEVVATLLVAVGYADDKFSLDPKLKLLGQVAVAFLTWWWADLGFNDLWPSIPLWLDCALTVFWIIGAVNAFNLIDGLDGLASGLALIATVGMASCLVFAGQPRGLLFYCVFAGALLGFLRYNYNPASVFLGDSGSMLIGYALSVLPLCTHAANSFLVSIGVPLLAMGVPIFDTALAILRRSLRHLLRIEGASAGNDRVMTADTDHLHHRILRSVGLNQRKAAWTLYALALFFVAVGLVGVSLRSRSAGLWLVAVVTALVIAFRDMARVELFDAGCLMDRIAHSGHSRMGLARLSVPIYLVTDAVLLILAYLFCCWVLKIPLTPARVRSSLVIHVAATFGCLVFFRTYVTVWARAVISNYIRLFLACVFGSVLATAIVFYAPTVPASQLKAVTVLYAIVPFVLLTGLRLSRSVIRDLFYALGSRRLTVRKDVTRLLVYGTGLRYRAFRRELVRSSAANSRVIVGLLDDDRLLRHHFIGGIQVKGALEDAPDVINELNVDAVVVAFEATDARLGEIGEVLRPTGVKVSVFSFSEKEI